MISFRSPLPEAYFEPINWHRTALHELGHWTGAAQRLDRDLSGSFGSKKYAQEDLVAEITSAFVCASLGIVPTVRHADYIGSWLEVLREDDRAMVRAASAASKAADYLLAFRPDADEPVKAANTAEHLHANEPQRYPPADRQNRSCGHPVRDFRGTRAAWFVQIRRLE